MAGWLANNSQNLYTNRALMHKNIIALLLYHQFNDRHQTTTKKSENKLNVKWKNWRMRPRSNIDNICILASLFTTFCHHYSLSACLLYYYGHVPRRSPFSIIMAISYAVSGPVSGMVWQRPSCSSMLCTKKSKQASIHQQTNANGGWS